MQRPSSDPMQGSLSGSIPESLQYGAEASQGLSGTRSMRNFAAENPGTFSPANNTIRIPVSASSFLDMQRSRLCFDLTNNGASTSQTLDGSAACVIQRLRILSNTGSELERMESYNLISAVLNQYQASEEDSRELSICGGGASFIGASGTGYNGVQCDVLNTNVIRHYEIKLLAGWFNPSLGKLLPPNVSFVLELTLASAASAFKCNATVAAANYTLTNLFLKIPAVRVDDAGFMQRAAMLQQRGYSFPAVTYKLYTSSTDAAAGSTSIQISDRSHSLTALIAVMRGQSKVNDYNDFKLCKRTLQYVSSYQFVIGADLYPPTQVELSTDVTPAGTASSGTAPATVQFTGASVAGLNVSAVYNQVKQVFPGPSIVDLNSFANSENTLNNGIGILAVDCKGYHSDKRTHSGIDTASQAVPITFKFMKTAAAVLTTASIPSTNIQVDVFAQCDIQFIMMPGGEMRSML